MKVVLAASLFLASASASVRRLNDAGANDQQQQGQQYDAANDGYEGQQEQGEGQQYDAANNYQGQQQGNYQGQQQGGNYQGQQYDAANNYQGQQQGNYQGQQQGGQQQQQQYENFEEYMKATMGSKTFSFTGCSNIKTAYGYTTYATYRLCDTCSSGWGRGCSAENGEYVVSMEQFSATYTEYQKEAYGQNFSPFECVRADEFANSWYEMHAQNAEWDGDGGNWDANGDNWQYQYNQQQQAGNIDYYVGPKCTGGTKVELGLFLNDACTYPAKSDIEKVLGFSPNSESVSPQKCISCALTHDAQDYGWDQYNDNEAQVQNQDYELNPLCESMIEYSGRCDRDKQSSGLDAFWNDVVSFVNDGGSTDFGDANQAYQAAQNAYNVYNDANGDAVASMSYNTFNKQSTCMFISNLPHMMGAWQSLKTTAENDWGLSTGELIMIIFFSIVVVFVVLYFTIRRCMTGKVAEPTADATAPETPYTKAEDEENTSKPWVSVT